MRQHYHIITVSCNDHKFQQSPRGAARAGPDRSATATLYEHSSWLFLTHCATFLLNSAYDSLHSFCKEKHNERVLVCGRRRARGRRARARARARRAGRGRPRASKSSPLGFS
ncbi:hypothetical protein EVAR_98913_1 [Eumeta japonica]|uniref:Uncharacterized protein n=1 Tax=Eumeta variegata TaxID=151549 RepID=A0A4C1Y5H0_EUMVA|nr:hypothetical protein EVAR_98913_1 [Eumeta japonica]